MLNLHSELNLILSASKEHWTSHDYGEGYFYQGLNNLNISGIRDTESRVRAYKLTSLVKDKSVLDIGCNSGFLDICLASSAKYIDALDINPFLIKCAEEVKDFTSISNINFFNKDFKDFSPAKQKYEVVLSFANHSTYDKNSVLDLHKYFEKISSLLVSGGTLIFESHHPTYETPEDLMKCIDEIKFYFSITEQKKLIYGTFADQGRTLIICKKKD